jgi:hypothetical protein
MYKFRRASRSLFPGTLCVLSLLFVNLAVADDRPATPTPAHVSLNHRKPIIKLKLIDRTNLHSSVLERWERGWLLIWLNHWRSLARWVYFLLFLSMGYRSRSISCGLKLIWWYQVQSKWSLGWVWSSRYPARSERSFVRSIPSLPSITSLPSSPILIRDPTALM